MSLLFGNLTQDFVDFSTAIRNVDPNDPQSSAKIDEAGKRFRHIAALDASYLTYIGKWNPIFVMSSVQSSPGLKVWACLSALSFTCMLGSTPAR